MRWTAIGRWATAPPADYAAFALEAAKLAKLTDPSVKLIAAGASNFRAGSDWIGWNRTVLESLKDYADYISLHLYVGNPDNDYADFVASPIEMDQKIEILAGTDRCRHVEPDRPCHRPASH